ncbi:MAG: molybdenum cofactor guanylyltransferase [Chloroflexi bacterium]|nr:molybdenum cofactor guanylyltransferase [Chloroflexota bacterium]
MKVTAIILAGGKSLRLGRNKALERILGRSLIERVVERVQPLAAQVLIVTSKEQLDLPALPGAEILTDIYPGKGPLGGIYTGLLAASYPYSIVVACDMPFLNTGLLRHMVELCEGFDAVVPRLDNGMVEPLHAVYASSCRDEVKAQLERGQLEVDALYGAIRVRYIEREEYQRFDPDIISFFNVNKEADLERAFAIASRGNRNGSMSSPD